MMQIKTAFLAFAMAFGVGCSELPPKEPYDDRDNALIGDVRAEEPQFRSPVTSTDALPAEEQDVPDEKALYD